MSQPLTVLIGASSGIGLAAARAFAAAGHLLLLLSRHIEPLPEFLDKPVVRAQVDVAYYDALQRAVRQAEERFGGADCLINSAGHADARPFEQVEPASSGEPFHGKVFLAGVIETRKSGPVLTERGSQRPYLIGSAPSNKRSLEETDHWQGDE